MYLITTHTSGFKVYIGVLEEMKTYISYFLTVPLGDLILCLCYKIQHNITHPFLSPRLVERIHRGNI